MPSRSQQSFGSRLQKAKDMAAFLTTVQGFNPPRPEEALVAYNALCDQAETLNVNEADISQQYNALVRQRYQFFRVDERGVIKLLVQIRGAVAAQYGTKSTEYEQVMTVIREIRSGKLSKTLADDGITEVKVSQSEQGYGAVTKEFGSLVSKLQNFVGYNPSRNDLQVQQLQAMYANIKQMNLGVATMFAHLRNTRDLRREIYLDLKGRTSRIKMYVMSEYGQKSREYEFVRKIKV